MKSLSVKTLYRFYINNIRTLLSIPLVLLTLTLTACGGGDGEAPAGSKFNPNLSFETSYEVNEGESVTITFSLDKSTLHDVSFDYTTSANTARAGEHFHSTSGNITIPSGEKTFSLTINTIDNAIAQVQNDFFLDITNVKGANVTSAQLSITINDNEPELSFNSSYQVTAGNEMKINFSLSTSSDHDITFGYHTIDDTALTDRDYQKMTGEVTLAAGETSTYITLNSLIDYSTNTDKQFKLQITDITGATAQSSDILVTITNNNTLPTLNFIETAQVKEGEAIIIIVSLSETSTEEVSFNYQTIDGTGKNSEDYFNENNERVIIPAGLNTTSITLNTLSNPHKQESSQFLFNINNIQGAQADTKQTLITIEDSTPELNFDTNISITEAEPVTITFTLSEPASHNISFAYQTTNRSAIAGKDYVENQGIATILAGQIQTSMNINTLKNINRQESSQFTLEINSLYGAKSATDQTLVTINDNTPSLSFNDKFSVGEAESLTVAFTLEDPAQHDITFNYILANGTAEVGKDFEDQTGQITILTGFRVAQLTINTLNNINKQADSQLLLTLVNLNGVQMANTQAIITIVDDTPELSFNSEYRADEGDNLSVIFTLQQAVQHNISFDYQTVNSSAVAGDDYTAVSGTATILAGSTTTTVPLATLINNSNDQSTQFILLINNLIGAQAPQEQAIISIINETPTLYFNTQYSVDEGEQVSLTFTLDDGSIDGNLNTIQHNITFDYQTIDNSAAAGDDYTPASGTATILAGSTTVTVPFTTLINEDKLQSTQFILQLSNVTGAQIDNSQIVISIVDDTPELSFESEYRVDEGDNLSVAFFLAQPVQHNISFDYQTIDSSAVAGDDFTASTGSINILAGSTTATLQLTTLINETKQQSTQFVLQLSTINGAQVPQKRATITIVDDTPELSFNSEYRVDEGDNLSVIFTLQQAVQHNISFNYQTINSSAVAGDDYTAVSGTATILAGSTTTTVPLTILTNNDKQQSTQFVLQLSTINGAQVPQKRATITIVDDTPELSFNSEYRVDEGDNLSVIFTLQQAVQHNITFDYQTIDSSAVAGDDFTASTGSINILAGSTTATLQLTTLINETKQQSTQFILQLSNVTGAQIDNSQIVITIVDDTPELSFNSEYSIDEGDNLSVIFTLQQAVQHNISFDYQTVNSSAVAGDDFTASTGSINILAGSTTTTVPLTSLINEDKQESTQFILKISNLTGAKAVQNQAIITIEDNTPVFSFNSDMSVKESELLPVEFTITEPLEHDITFDYKLIEGTAEANKDYVGQTGSVTIPAGYKFAQLFLTTIDNINKQSDTQFILALTNTHGGKASHHQTIITIEDNTPNLNFTTTHEVKEANNLVVNFSLSKATPHEVTFKYQTQSGSAIAGTDFVNTNGTSTILAGDTTASITITTKDNAILEQNTNFTLLLTDLTGAKSENNFATITIIDITPELSFNNKHQVLEGSQVNITLTLSEAVQRRVEVNYQTADGSAKADDDYQAIDSVVYFEPGELTTTVTLTTLFNYENHDTISFDFLVDEVKGATSANNESIIEITNNESEISFQNNFYIEEGTAATIEFRISTVSDHDITLKYETEAGSALVGTDFEHSSGVLNIINTYNEKGFLVYRTTLPLYTIARSGVQADRDFFMNVVELNGATTTIDRVRITITDAIETSKVGFEQLTTQASYQAGSLSIAVTKSVASTEEIIIPFVLSGTAVSGQAFTLTNTDNEIVFAANATEATIDLSIIDNALPRSGSTINFLLKANAGNEIDVNKAAHSVVLSGNFALNDTGALTSDDALHGRDSNNDLNDDGDGKSGFSFTKIDYQGNKLERNASSFSCVLDNVTGLTYEAKQTSGTTYGTAYNARLSDNEISQLGVALAIATYQDIYNAFPDDFTSITGFSWENLLDNHKVLTVFTEVIYLTDNEIDAMLTTSNRAIGETLTYPFNSAQLELHSNWRSNEHSYYWLNEDDSTNGGRAGSVAEFNQTNFPVSKHCAFPHEDMTNYVDDIKGCNSTDYLKVMNDLAICGYSDWRIPEVEELRSIVNYDISDPVWDAKFTPNSNTFTDYISASPSVSNDASVWCVTGNTGETKLCHKQLPHNIRAVRGEN
jgi:hypothetical protein